MAGAIILTSVAKFSFACFLCLLPGHVFSQSPLSLDPPPNIVVAVNKVRVPYGRSVYINPVTDLQINVADGDHCFVTVLPSPLSQQPGHLSPERFPCDFGPEEVKYSHLGSRSPSEDNIPLQIRYDTPTETFIIPVTLPIEVLFVQRTIITKSLFLTVNELLGVSNPLNGDILGFTYDPSTQQCQVATLPGSAGLPRYGYLLNDPSQGSMISCMQFVNAGLRYNHTSPSNSPNRDHIPMVVELLDNNGNLLKQEYFQVAVKIVNGAENIPPKISFASVLLMEVDQFVMTAFTDAMLLATDVESNPEDLIFNITSPLPPQNGEVVSTDDRNTPITSFRQSDVNELRIAYKPSATDSNTPRYIEIQMQVVDTEGLISEPFTFIVVVNPMNTLAPVVTKNTGQLLYQGQQRPLSSALNLEISDEDNLDDVKIFVLRGPNHGQIIKARKFFTPADLDNGLVIYRHDGSNTYSDNVIFRMTDGEHEVEFLFPIVVAPLDNTPPNVDTNTGLTVNKGEMVMVSSWVLNAADIDSDQMRIKFILETPYSREGQFLLVVYNEPQTNDSSLYRRRPDARWEKVVHEWTQANILDMELYYRHIGPHSTGVVMDVHPFRVEDDSEPPNVSDLHEFVVKVLPVDDILPSLYPNTSLHMDVQEFELTPFNRKMLRYTDVDTDDKELVYTITGPLTEFNPIVPLPNAGKIVLTENPTVPVTTFTQAQVNHHKVAYQPPNTELGIVSRSMRFTFKVSDNAGNELPDQEFSIYLNPVNNKPPRIVNTGFTVNERAAAVISPSILDATDQDTDESVITFVLAAKPTHGTLQYDTQPIELGGAFTKADIAESHIIYQQNGDEVTEDSFRLDVSDGMHTIPIVVRITVQPIDDELPLLARSHDGTLNFKIEVAERGSVSITPDVLSATDSDTNDLDLTFVVADPASKGQIMVSGQVTQKFTQRNIQDGVVTYEHQAGEIGEEADRDSFELTLTDMSDEWRVGGNRVEKVVMEVTINPIDSEAPFVTTIEDFFVDEGEKAMIEPIHLDATDVDTNDANILCVITTQASEGFVENTSPAPGSEKSRAGIPVSSFTIADIRAGNIFYVQSAHENQEPTEDRFSFVCQDGTPNLSDPMFFNVNINSVNEEKPILYHTEFVVDEGGTLVVDLPKLYAEDADVPEDELTFTITEPPKNGRFLRLRGQEQVPVTSFSLRDVASGADIVYEHDDTETTEDKFSIKVSDGVLEDSAIIPITILPVDDETPRMTINNGIDVDIMETKVIGNDVLKATDLDSEDSTLMYTITFAPQHGKLNLTDSSGVSRVLGVKGNFTQADIDNGRLTYSHTGHEGVRDLIKFDVTDGFNPLIDRYFYVNVAYMDMLFPDVINKGVTLKEKGRVTLTTDILSTADLNSADENLEFSVTRAPQRGHLESTDLPGQPITTFTQLDLAGSKIQYIHTGDDEIKMDSFEFEVTDGFNPVYRTFRISISDVDNKKPIVTKTSLRVKEGFQKLITPFELKIEDRDTNDDLLRLHITQVPVHGRILLDEEEEVREFSMSDLNENRVSYFHDGTETVSDSFSFTVTDGTHDDFYVFPNTVFTTSEPQRMDIEIVPVDNSVPQMLVNIGAPSISNLDNGKRGFRITKKTLLADDRDSNVTALTYVITTQPSHGILVNAREGNSSKAVDTFTQGDVNSMSVHYILNSDTNATADSFTFTIRDAGGNELPDQEFNLNWAFISLESATYRVNEDAKKLVLKLVRRGYLGETSFVTIGTKDGTAKSGKDFKGKSQSQVQFNPGQTKRTWKVKVLQDNQYEESEDFLVLLSDPVMAILEDPKNTTVTIHDPEDESTVYIPSSKYVVDENTGELQVPVHRSGDLTNELMVICYTVSGSAVGTKPTTVHSFSDYISRPEDHNSLITFGRNESEKICRIVIIDDSLYEDDETFNVTLTQPMGGRLGNFSSSQIVIASDSDDEPLFYFDQSSYNVDESVGHVTVRVWRTGTDLTKTASVTVLSKKSDPESAKANVDYVGISQTLEFAPGITMKNVKVVILDDLGNPVMEGLETFDLVLRMPIQAILGEPQVTHITINDTGSDLPSMEFAEAEYEVNEDDASITALVQRSGDLSHSSSVRCYTRQATAEVTSDYAERPNTNASLVTFEPGQSEARCVVVIENDQIHEDPEQFRLVLGTSTSESAGNALLGTQKEALITITDIADKSIIEFAQTSFDVTEPVDDDEPVIVSVPVVRKGDRSEPSVVRVYTKDGNAESGKDYNPVSKLLHFDKGVEKLILKIEILFDDEKEIRESFTVRLEPDQNMVSELGEKRAIVHINQQKILADVTFPSNPTVVSLLDYDDTSTASGQPSPGYPVICVSPCNPKHSDYKEVSSICDSEGLDDSATQFRWLVAAPSGENRVTNRLREVGQKTFFTDTNEITLDSIYFKPGSRVACAARAVNQDGDAGLESMSEPVTINSESNICPPRVAGSVGAEPFSAKIRYTGPADPKHPNLIRVSVSMPHIDGMLPVISTRQLSNFEITLSKDGTRVGNHRCSNILNHDELTTQFGFLTNSTRNPNIVDETYPYRYNSELRGNNTLRFYRNLNLEACLWQFTTYFDMSELLTECGGNIGTDGQVRDLVQSYVSLRVPLYVSYVFHSPVGRGWQHFDQQTELRLSFVYDTAILWDQGIATPPEAELQGSLYPTSMRIREDGKLVVNFRTKARFRGQFVAEHPGSNNVAMVMSESHPELRMTLKLIRSEATYNNPEQKWSFESDYAIRDYSGTYTIKLLPCVSPPGQAYTISTVCNPRDPISFDMDIRFQQVSDPVAEEFSLNTNFFLLSKKSLYLSDGSMGFAEDSDSAFAEGAEIYGRVLVDPVQNLGDSFDTNIEKVFVCAGKDGYIPKYNPENQEYGCLADTPNLRERFKILDKEQPDTQDLELNSVNFNARLALDDPESLNIVRQPGTDGFRLETTPLFTVTVGREWYLHAIYTVKALDQRRKRAILYTYHSMIRSSAARSKRAVEGVEDMIGKNFQRGTQMKYLKLEKRNVNSPFPGANPNQSGNGMTPNESGFPILYIIIGGAVLILLIALLIVALVARRRSKNSPQDDAKGQYTSAKNIVVTRKSGGATSSAVVSKRSSSGYSSDNSEV